MTRIYPDATSVLDGLLFDGMTICAGGFGLCGVPEQLIDAIRDSGVSVEEIAAQTSARYSSRLSEARTSVNG